MAYRDLQNVHQVAKFNWDPIDLDLSSLVQAGRKMRISRYFYTLWMVQNSWLWDPLIFTMFSCEMKMWNFFVLIVYENACEADDQNLPDLICAVTGKGPLKEFWHAIMQQKKWRHVKVVTPWLENEDYPKLLGNKKINSSPLIVGGYFVWSEF